VTLKPSMACSELLVLEEINSNHYIQLMTPTFMELTEVKS